MDLLVVSDNRVALHMLFEDNCFSTCPSQYLVLAGLYMEDCTLYLLFIPLLPVYKASAYLALVLKDSQHY